MYTIVVLMLLCMIPLVIWGSRYHILSIGVRWIIPKTELEESKLLQACKDLYSKVSENRF